MKWFQDQNAVRRSFECAVCFEVLKYPVQVRECGHQFCTFCIDEVLRFARLISLITSALLEISCIETRVIDYQLIIWDPVEKLHSF